MHLFHYDQFVTWNNQAQLDPVMRIRIRHLGFGPFLIANIADNQSDSHPQSIQIIVDTPQIHHEVICGCWFDPLVPLY